MKNIIIVSILVLLISASCETPEAGNGDCTSCTLTIHHPAFLVTLGAEYHVEIIDENDNIIAFNDIVNLSSSTDLLAIPCDKIYHITVSYIVPCESSNGLRRGIRIYDYYPLAYFVPVECDEDVYIEPTLVVDECD